MKKRRSDYLPAGLLLLCVGFLFLFLNRGLQITLALHFSLLHIFECALLLILAVMPRYQRSILRRSEEIAAQLAEEPEDAGEEYDREELEAWKPVTGATLALVLVLLLSVVMGMALLVTGRSGSAVGQSAPIHTVVCVVVFILYACVEKWWSVKEDNGENLGLCRLMVVNKAAVLILFADLVMDYTGIANIARAADLLMMVLWGYLAVSVSVGLILKRIRHPEEDSFPLFLPMPFHKGGGKHSLTDWLERNTGISMRSLWSLKFLRVSLPTCVLGGMVLLWLSTCVVQVDTYQQGALYRFGRLSESDILQPGLHFKLPVPFEVAKVCDVSHTQTMVVGYEGDDETTNNLWTMGHKGEEHKLLLGAGRELVAINLKISYRISDLHAYLTNYADPEAVLNAKGYEIIMHHMVNTDINTIMSVDRSALSKEIETKLAQFAEEAQLGIEVQGVTLASIHPPVEISDVYQSVVSAGIQKKANVLTAEGDALKAKEEANAEHQVTINQADITHDNRVSAAKAESIEYNASLKAYRLDPEAFRMNHYLDAVQNALSGKKKYLLGEGVDVSSLYSGFLPNLQGPVQQWNGQEEASTPEKTGEDKPVNKTDPKSDTKPDTGTEQKETPQTNSGKEAEG